MFEELWDERPGGGDEEQGREKAIKRWKRHQQRRGKEGDGSVQQGHRNHFDTET